MPLSPEMERLKKAAASKSEDEAGVIADAAAELENTAALPVAVAAFARAAGIDPVAIQTAPEATAQAFGRELADLKAAQSALPKPERPTPREFYGGTRLLESKRKEMQAANWPPGTLAALENRILPRPVEVNAVSLSRTPEDGDDRVLAAIDTIVNVYDALIASKTAPPLGKFAGGREAPRQAPAGGAAQKTPEEVQAEVDANLAQTELGRRALAARRAEATKA